MHVTHAAVVAIVAKARSTWCATTAITIDVAVAIKKAPNAITRWPDALPTCCPLVSLSSSSGILPVTIDD